MAILGMILAMASGAFASIDLPRRAEPLPSPKRAIDNERLGLFPAGKFRLTTGHCKDCPTPRQALWYFQDEIIAVPNESVPVAGFSRGIVGYDQVFREVKGFHEEKALPYPSLVWIGSPEILEQVTLSPRGDRVQARDGKGIPLALTPKIPSNRSYYDHSSTRFFQDRPLRIRGTMEQKNGRTTFVARTIWPEDYKIDTKNLSFQPLQSKETLAGLITDSEGRAQSPLQTRLIWQRHREQPREWAGRPVLGFLLSGGQGDDDESQGGHFAVVTGRIGPNGEMADWMVNNFYSLDEESEKGIIAAMVPMDNYLMDLNSGQSYYRPAYLLFAVLREERAAQRFQGAIGRVYNHFYRHDFLYHHSKANCTSISVDTLRAIGWEIPRRGPTGYFKGSAAFFYLSWKELSLTSGKKMFDYLTEEQTRLFPRVAFEVAGNDLLRILGGQAGTKERPLTPYEQILQNDVAAVLFVRIPQIPSSRAFGTYPVTSFDEYRKRVPADRSKWKIVQVNPRPFPEHLKDNMGANSRRSLLVPVMILICFALLSGVGAWIFIATRPHSKIGSDRPGRPDGNRRPE